MQKSKALKPAPPPAAPASIYAPEVEAHRADYERLSEALVTMVMLETQRRYDALDLPQVSDGDAQFKGAVLDHLYSLWHEMDWFDPRTIRRFYVDLRLYTEQHKLEVRQEYEREQAERGQQ